ncbi:sensor histidine kinase [Leptospira ilyithenensis]|uniref:histidine kinase n=1 Tax=Leptospira ilyithenensis TaxID=2484901 RepID=A0A4R9LMY0_9LEPT|nr:HAMP domain-containing sensor histidine kinase [Leptospira ilyithenensis]TGN10058.1 sensor histidine kinase [Leptospira ilyithenensis]
MRIYTKIIAVFIIVLGLIAMMIACLLYIDRNYPHLSPRNRDFKPIFKLYVDVLDTKSSEERQKSYQDSKSDMFQMTETDSAGLEQLSANNRMVIKSNKFPDRYYLVIFEKKRIFFLIGITLIQFLILLLLISFVIKKTLKPLKDLANSMYRIANGDFYIRLGEKLNDPELKLLAQGFNHMVAKLESSKKRDQLLLQSISHELRSPIASLIFLYEIIREKKSYDRLTEIGEGIFSLEKTLNEIDLIATGIISGSSIDIYSVDLKILLSEFIQENSNWIHNKGKTCHLKETNPGSVYEVKGNENYAKIIFKNIIQNAIYYENPTARIDICLEGDSESLKIIFPLDQNIDEDSVNLFTPFYRGKEASLKNPKGKGLGLSIAKSLCETMGWSIQYKNTAFLIEIPV